MPPQHTPEVAFVPEKLAALDTSAQKLVLTEGGSVPTDGVPEDVVGYVSSESLSTDVAPIIVALASVCSRR